MPKRQTEPHRFGPGDLVEDTLNLIQARVECWISAGLVKAQVKHNRLGSPHYTVGHSAIFNEADLELIASFPQPKGLPT